MDWDRLRIFYAAARAGSFTRAGETLAMSQSAVSRQVSALESELNATLFHRHARGLVLTEQGELLYRTAHEVFQKLQTAEELLADTKTRPSGALKVTAPVGIGAAWLTPRLREFVELYPDITLEVILSDQKLDISMREADVGIWLKEPEQQDLIRRPLFTVHLHAYAAVGYLRRFGTPKAADELDSHHIIAYGGKLASEFRDINWLETAARNSRAGRRPILRLDNVFAVKEAVAAEIGVAVLPDYLVRDHHGIVRVLAEADLPKLHSYFVYPEELRNSKRVNVFRDFIVSKARQWTF